MNYVKHGSAIRWGIIIASFAIVTLILWKTYEIFQLFKSEERIKIENWSFAQKEFTKSDYDGTNLDLILKILNSNHTTPMLVINKEGQLTISNNIDEHKIKDSTYLRDCIERFKREYEPIDIVYKDKILSTIYYGNSPLLNKLKYYPLALVLIIFLFVAIVFFFYRSNKNAAQNRLWSGMAKETAHQIGTPLSSLMGWVEILKAEHVNPDYIDDIEKDIDRLQIIVDRFSKIGSLPKLTRVDIIAETTNSFHYLKSRLSKQVNFQIKVPEKEIFVNLNQQLYSWSIENLVKNAIDAMKGEGNISIDIFSLDHMVCIRITDTGKGIPRHKFETIFEPGFTTKKRGWGLGLSLTKRIIEDFHKGKIKVLKSEIGKGTTFQIKLKTI